MLTPTIHSCPGGASGIVVTVGLFGRAIWYVMRRSHYSWRLTSAPILLKFGVCRRRPFGFACRLNAPSVGLSVLRSQKPPFVALPSCLRGVVAPAAANGRSRVVSRC
jgi:hypothetical protein